ncbi:hypothetical protein DYB37_008861 [Aphanomyces astaci]|uniref:WW domain-containing protein n=5 Tax=Aphanomyces astaci TaxID=112090 RepID=A0A397EVC5_APHAT|nr:hypothetical protein DYB31_009067 [Aphanomyces astaci]RHZ10122.1 hypothetical protein DYB37_008861 [Aphanomyces astaci]
MQAMLTSPLVPDAQAEFPGCLYSNKSCANPRTTKKDGSLHRLCAYHQERANSRQKQYLRKRKHMEAGPPPAVRPNDTARVSPRAAGSMHLRGIEPIAFDAEEATLSDTEVQMLAASMTGDDYDVDDDPEDGDDVDNDDSEGNHSIHHSTAQDTSDRTRPRSMWVRHLDEDSTRFYYHNPTTGETAWTKPEGYTEVNDSHNTRGSSSSDGDDDKDNKPAAKRARPSTSDDVKEGTIEEDDEGALWVKFVDPISKKPYYSDMNSGRTRWDQPTFYTSDQGEDDDEVEEDQLEEEYAFGAVAAPSSPKASPTAATDKPAAVTPAFLRYIDPSTQVPYYFNTATKETTWDVPPSDAVVQDAPSSAATTSTDTSSAGSAKYQEWLNKATTVPQATRAAAAAASISRNTSDPVHRLNSILGGSARSFRWQQHFDEKNQRYYYHDTTTNTTQWDPPADGSAVAAVGGADWVPATAAESSHEPVTSQSEYTVVAHMNMLSGRFSGASGDQYFHKQNIPTDKAGRQLSNFFDLTAFEANRAEAKRLKDELKTKNIDWKKYNEDKKRKRHRVRNKWMYED